MARHDGEDVADAAVGHGYAGTPRHADRGRDPGHDRHGQPGLHGGRDLLAAPAEDVGVAALEPHDREAGEGALDHDALDLVLGHGMVSGRLPTSTTSAPGARRATSPTSASRSVSTTSASARARIPASVSSSRPPGPAPTRTTRPRGASGTGSVTTRQRPASASRTAGPRRTPARRGHREPDASARLGGHVTRRGGHRDHGAGPLVATHDRGRETGRPTTSTGSPVRSVSISTAASRRSSRSTSAPTVGSVVFRPRFRHAMPR